MPSTSPHQGSGAGQEGRRSWADVLIEATSKSVAERLQRSSRLSFNEYLTNVLFESPNIAVSNGADLVLRAFRHYRTHRVRTSIGEIDAYNIANCPWMSEMDPSRPVLTGHEIPLHHFVRAIEDARQHGTAAFPTGIIGIHGPTNNDGLLFLDKILPAALEDFTRNHEQGALYTFQFRFPWDAISRAPGFNTWARDGEAADAIRSEMQKSKNPRELVFRAIGNTPPFFLLPNDRPHAHFTEGKSERIGNYAAETLSVLTSLLNFQVPDEEALLSEFAEEKRGLSIRELFLSLAEKCGKIPPDFNRPLFFANGLSPFERSMMELLTAQLGISWQEVVTKYVEVIRYSLARDVGQGLVAMYPQTDERTDIRSSVTVGQSPGLPDPIAAHAGKLEESRGPVIMARFGVLHYPHLFQAAEVEAQRSLADDINQDLARVAAAARGEIQVYSSPFGTGGARNEPFYGLVVANVSDRALLGIQGRRRLNEVMPSINLVTWPYSGRYRDDLSRLEVELERRRVSTPDGSETLRSRFGPHALEAYVVFHVLTRLLRPNPDHFNGIPELAELLARKPLKMIEKAQLIDGNFTDEEFNILRVGEACYTAEEMNILRRHEDIIRREYLRGVGEVKFRLYDGGLGISAKTATERLCRLASNADHISVTEILNYVGERCASGFRYITDVDDQKTAYREVLENSIRRRVAQEYKLKAQVQARREETQNPAPAGTDPQGGLSGSPEEIAQQIENEVQERVQHELAEVFPVPDPSELYSELDLWIRMKVRQDIGLALNMVEVKDPWAAFTEYFKSLETGGPQASEFEDRFVEGRELFERIWHFESPEIRREFRELIKAKGLAIHDPTVPEQDRHAAHVQISRLVDVVKEQAAEVKPTLERFLTDTRRYYLSEGRELVSDLSASDETKRKSAERWQEAVKSLQEKYQASRLAEQIESALRRDDRVGVPAAEQ